MTPVLVGIAAFCVVAGILLLVVGLRKVPREPSTARSTSLWTTVDNWWRRCSRTQRIHIGVTFAAAAVIFVLTGWPVALVLVPLLGLGLPALLADPPNRDVQILEALDRWVRSLAASLPTGKSVTDAIRATSGQAPELIRSPVQVMVARLDSRWTPREALLALADDLDSPDADAVIAALVLSARRGGVGAAATLAELADSIQARLRALREIEAERAKPRVVVRQVTLISVVAVGLGVLLQPHFFAPYRSPIGQVVLSCLVLAYGGSLAIMRRITRPRRRERILRQGAVPSKDVVIHA